MILHHYHPILQLSQKNAALYIVHLKRKMNKNEPMNMHKSKLSGLEDKTLHKNIHIQKKVFQFIIAHIAFIIMHNFCIKSESMSA